MFIADAGNPHAVLYRDDPAGDLPRLGPPLAVHSAFERGTNVELVRWHEGVLDVHVWERGVGPTLACGTGACAVAAVAWSRGDVSTDTPITIGLPGGRLTIRLDRASGASLMRGSARHVFDGTWH
jgi:diaminopimelate epimerase